MRVRLRFTALSPDNIADSCLGGKFTFSFTYSGTVLFIGPKRAMKYWHYLARPSFPPVMHNAPGPLDTPKNYRPVVPIFCFFVVYSGSSFRTEASFRALLNHISIYC